MTVQRTLFWRPATILSTLITLASPVPANLAQSSQSGVRVLRLPYRGAMERDGSVGYSAGMFASQTLFHVAALMGTDYDGCIYIMDPSTRDQCVLRRFDRHGSSREHWGPIQALTGKGVAVTKDDYVWVAIETDQPEAIRGLPIVVYRKGQRQPSLDWRIRGPREVETVSGGRIGSRDRVTPWAIVDLESGGNEVSLRFLRLVNDSAQLLIVRATGSGKIKDVQLGTPSPFRKEKYLSPDGRVWTIESDFDRETFKWSKVWIHEVETRIEHVLIDRRMRNEPWPERLRITDSFVPQVARDVAGQIYLFFARRDSQPHLRRFVVGGKVYDDFDAPPMEGERALVVLDSIHRVISHVGWTSNTFEIQDRWVKPLPDGSGFYRIQFHEKEAVVYFHALPK